MSVVRIVRDRQYTVISNSPLQDTRLSLKARGLIAYCFSLPADWRYSIEGLVKAIGSDGRDAIRGALKELEKCGYLKRRRLHDERGKFTDTEYVIYETAQTEEPTAEEAEERTENEKKLPTPLVDKPVDNTVDKGDRTANYPDSAKPTWEKPTLENPTSGNPTLVDLQGFIPITENPTLAKPTLGKPTSENRLQQSKYINKINITTTTTAETGEDAALSPDVHALAKGCCVSELALKTALHKFGAAEVDRYLSYMSKQQNIKNPNAWLNRALREKWDIAAIAPCMVRPDCSECGGKGYTMRVYLDAASEQEQQIRLKCAKCCGS